MLYSRLLLFKNSAKQKADRSNDPSEPSQASIMSGIQAELNKLDDRLSGRLQGDASQHYYELMLESCEKLFDNELEQGVFEEMTRYMFGLKVSTPCHRWSTAKVTNVIAALL